MREDMGQHVKATATEKVWIIGWDEALCLL